MKGDAEALSAARSFAWREIKEAVSSGLTDREKLEKCLNISRLHYALTGDDTLTPPQIRDKDNALIESLPKQIERANQLEKRRKSIPKDQPEMML